MSKRVPGLAAVTLLSKPGCHLCDDAREVIDGVRGSLDQRGIATTFDEVNILEDAALARKYAEDIPVVFVNGRQHAIWRVDPERLTVALERAGRMSRLFGR